MTEEKKKRINTEEDFIDYPKFKNSVKKLIEKYPDGVDDETIAKVLLMTEEEVNEIYLDSIEKIKNKLGV